MIARSNCSVAVAAAMAADSEKGHLPGPAAADAD